MSYQLSTAPLFISDTHLFDVASIDWRPSFPSVYSYADHLIESWNRFTLEDNIVFLVGDIGHYCSKTLEVLRECKGHKLLIIGNHDVTWGSKLYNCDLFDGIYGNFLLDTIYISHTPAPTNVKHTWFVHGHHHRYDMPGMYNALDTYARDTYRLNCSADLNNHRPCSLQELLLNKEVMLDKYRETGLLKED